MKNLNHAFDSPLKVEILLAYSLISNGVDGVSFCNLKQTSTLTLDSKLINILGYKNIKPYTDSITWDILIHHDDLKAVNLHISSCVENPGYKFEQELKCFQENGNILWFRCSSFVVTDPDTALNTLVTTYTDISKYEKTFNQLYLKINRFNHVIEGAHFGSWECNVQTNEIIINNRWAEIIGYSLAELGPITKDTWKKHTHREDYKKAEILLQEHIDGKSDFYACQIRMKHRDGQWVWVFSRGKISSYSKDGNVEWVGGSHYDITHIKQNETELVHQKALIEQVNEIAQLGAWELNLETNELYWSSTIKKMLELDDDFKTTIENTTPFIYKKEDQDLRVSYTIQAVSTGKPFDHTLQLKTKTGKLLWARYTGNVKYKNNVPIAVYGFLQDIDDQITSNLKLAQQEEQFRKVFEFAHNGMSLVDLKGKFLKVNNSLCKMLGYSKQEFESLTFQAITTAEFIQKDLDLIQDIFENKIDSYQLEKQYIRKDGSLLDGLLSVSLVKDNHGEPLHFISQINDITQRKNNELLLKQNTNLLESVNEAAQIGIWEYDLNENKVYWSPIIKKLMGVSTDFDPSLEDAVNFFKEGEDRDKIAKLVASAIETGQNYDVDLQVVTLDNQAKWARTIGISEFKDGQCVKLYGFFQNIDAIKKAELQIALKEEQWRTTFNHSKTGMALIDLTGQVQMTNQSLCDVLGYTEAEMKTMTIIDITFPEDLNDTFKFMEGVISGKQEGYNFEKRYITKKGNVIWANASVAAVKNDKNEFTHVVAQIVDITENKLLNESILEHNNRLINFAHIVSHNLRSHTGNMTMLLEISRTNNPDLLDEEIFQHLKTSSENMNDCVNYLSEIVEINTKVKDTLLSLNLKDYVNKALQNVQISVNEINCEIEINVADDLNVIAIPAYLDSIILNLITNALKYHSPKRSPKIIITSNQSEKYITLDITDNGQGIDLKKHGDKLFGMYKTFHDHKDARGIGLFISKNQIEAIGGKIEVKSEVNQGTTFKIYFKHEHSN